MSASSEDMLPSATARSRGGVGLAALLREWVYRHGVTVLAMIAIVYLLAPIAMMVALSFNKTVGRFDFAWHAFSIKAWLHPFSIEGLQSSLYVSLVVAVVAATVATTFGTLLGYAQVKFSFYGKRLLDLLLLLTISTPEVIIGSSLLNLYLDIKIPTGMGTLMISHIMFDIAFTAIVVKSRLRTFDFALEHAAMDLGASGIRVFRKITLPLIAPAVIMGGLLAFMLSLDDFIISNFVSGPTVTFPLFVWGEARVAMPPQIYVMGTCMFGVLTLLLAATATVDFLRRRAQT
ncbi:MAG TPA: ABC transporter permease subunit, partial [Gammaproteobacteria bacterium]|nr:ABC transporter permease subunit [Gammaproteobacteria bacterium]